MKKIQFFFLVPEVHFSYQSLVVAAAASPEKMKIWVSPLASSSRTKIIVVAFVYLALAHFVS